MANTKNVKLKRVIAGVETYLFPKTLATLVDLGEGKNVEQKIADIIALIADKTDMTAVETRLQEIIGSAPAALDTLAEIAAALNNDKDFAAGVTTALAGKVDKVEGKDLSTNDFTDALKEKLEGLKTTLTKSDVGLGNVDNTSDMNKPVSTAQQTAINSAVAGKVDAVVGKGLSTEDFTTEEKTSLASLVENEIIFEEV